MQWITTQMFKKKRHHEITGKQMKLENIIMGEVTQTPKDTDAKYSLKSRGGFIGVFGFGGGWVCELG